MAHIVPIEDSSGDMVDYEVYCSDFCSRTTSDNYSGWYGLVEISTSQPCESCGNMVQGLDEE